MECSLFEWEYSWEKKKKRKKTHQSSFLHQASHLAVFVLVEFYAVFRRERLGQCAVSPSRAWGKFFLSSFFQRLLRSVAFSWLIWRMPISPYLTNTWEGYPGNLSKNQRISGVWWTGLLSLRMRPFEQFFWTWMRHFLMIFTSAVRYSIYLSSIGGWSFGSAML